MPHPSLLVKINGMIPTLLRLTKDSFKPKYTIPWGNEEPKRHYGKTNLKVAEEAHKKHIESLK